MRINRTHCFLKTVGITIPVLILSITAAFAAAPEPTYLEIHAQALDRSHPKTPPEALKLWQKCVEMNPVEGDNWSRLGEAYYNAKDYAKSIPAYEKAMELKAGYPSVSAYNIACCYGLMGDKEKSLTWLDKALNMGFRNLAQVRMDTDLNVLHGDERFTKLAATADVSKMSRDEGWRYDLWLLTREARRIHYSPYQNVSKEQMDAYIQKLNDDIPTLNDDQIMVGFMKFMRMLGDGHTSIRPRRGPQAPMSLPVQFYLYKEGLFIDAATPDHADLAGAQVLRFGEHTVEETMKALDPVISRDNSIWPTYIGPMYMRNPAVLHGLGLIPSNTSMALTIRDAAGKERTISLEPATMDPKVTLVTAHKDAVQPLPLYLKNTAAPYWYEYLPDTKTVYFQYNAVRNDPKEPLTQFCDRLFKFIEGNPVEKLVIDMRWNGGGNNFLNAPIIRGLVRCDKINQQGKLFVIIGRNTFSAAQCGITQIERFANPIFVGEPSGSKPNFVGETIPVDLPYSKIHGSVSDLYWQNSVAMDYRTWIAPELYAPPTFEAFKTNRDPAMEAILCSSK